MKGFYKSVAGAGQCSACVYYATTLANASTNITDYFCAPPDVWESGPVGPGTINGVCVAVCAAGATGSAGVCTLCATGTYKSVAGSATCSACSAPFSASLSGAVLASACTCPAGFLDNYGTDYVYVSSVGALSEVNLITTVLCANYGDGVPCAVAADPAQRLRAVVFSPAANATIKDITVRVSYRNSTLLLYACTSDCEANATIHLHRQRGALVITASGSASATLQRHVGRALQAHTPALITPAQAEAAVLRYNLHAGDAMWIPASGGLASCEPCLPGLACV